MEAKIILYKIKIDQIPLELTFPTSVNNSTVEKKLVFYPNKYFVDIVVNFKSLSNSISQNRVNLMWKGGVPMTEPNPKDEGTFYASNISQGGVALKTKLNSRELKISKIVANSLKKSGICFITTPLFQKGLLI